MYGKQLGENGLQIRVSNMEELKTKTYFNEGVIFSKKKEYVNLDGGL